MKLWHGLNYFVLLQGTNLSKFHAVKETALFNPSSLSYLVLFLAHIFDYADSCLLRLFSLVPTSQDNRGSTVLLTNFAQQHAR